MSDEPTTEPCGFNPKAREQLFQLVDHSDPARAQVQWAIIDKHGEDFEWLPSERIPEVFAGYEKELGPSIRYTLAVAEIRAGLFAIGERILSLAIKVTKHGDHR